MALKPKLNNHVSKRGKRIAGLLKGKYGVDLTTLDAALMGNPKAMQAIGEAARQGRQISEFMPLLQQAYTEIIKGTEDYNKGIATILKQGANSAIAIDKAASQTLLANQKYANQRKEIAAEFVTAKQAETTRHQYAINYVQLKAYIDRYISQVDGDARLQEQVLRPEVKQFDEDIRHRDASNKHLLQYGEQANLDLMPRREYATVTEGNKTVTFREKVGQLFSSTLSAIGF